MADTSTPARNPQSTAGEANPFAKWDNTPLFMKSLPKEQGGADGDEGNTESATLDAIQALLYEGDASEVAAGLKAQANELFAARKYRDAVGFYTRAIEECGKDLEMEERRVLWSNRAAANLELGNFGATLKDTSLVISNSASAYPALPSPASNKTTLKALLRSARALSGLEKLPEALDALSRLQILEKELDQEKDDVGRKVREEVEAKVNKKARRAAELEEKNRRIRESEEAMRVALSARGVVSPKTSPKNALFSSCPIDITPPHFDPDSLPASSVPSLPLIPSLTPSSNPFITWQPAPPTTPIIFPVFLLLPLAEPPTRDLCLTFHTLSTFGEVLESMDHDPTALNMYIATSKGRVLKVGAKLTLEKVLQAAGREGDGWVLQEGWALEMCGVPKGVQGDDWVAGWKKDVKEGVAAIL